MRSLGMITLLIASFVTVMAPGASGASLSLVTAPDYESGYDRAAFRHWIDADKDGCDTRAEVLIEEAIVKPKVGKKCALSGGKWRSQYDKLVTTNPSALDIDHLVPLAEAWRSGAWAWTDAEREAFANDLEDSRSLVAVSASSNRSKGDKDYSQWQPKLSDGTEKWIGCNYLKAWIAIKMRYALTMDSKEATWVSVGNTTCAFGDSIFIKNIPAAPSASPSPSQVALGNSIGGIGDYSNRTIQYLNYFKETHPNFKGIINYTVEDPPIGYYTEDLNINCKIVSIDYTTDVGKTVFEYSTIDVLARCRWVQAESIAGSSWKWRAGTNTTPVDPTVCGKLIEVVIDGIKALACAPADPAPSPTKSSSTNGAKQCWVNGYTTKKGTKVSGYYRSC